jgi:hypothetical protein
MQFLTKDQVAIVAGGFRYTVDKEEFFSEENLERAGRFSRGWGYIGAAFSVGYAVGTVIRDNTGIDEWLNEAING